MKNHHFLIVCFPAQGHINPSLQLAQRLLRLGINVTFATTVFASRLMKKTHLISSFPKAFSFATFSDGFDNQRFKPDSDVSINHYFSELKRCGTQSLNHLFVSSINESRPITFVIYSLLLNWAADVASNFNVPSSLIFVQPATLLALYYYYFNGYGDQISSLINHNDPSSFLELPGFPFPFSFRDIPSFLSPSNPHAFLITPMKEQIEFLDKQTHSNVLVNTFDALEVDALKAMDHKLKIVPIGPLISPSSFGGSGGDLFQSSNEEDNNYIEWLNSKPESSVVYISFGTICVLSDKQEEEVVNALLDSGYAFLWVIRVKEEEEEEKRSSWKSKLEEKGGKIVSWCCQVEVLSQPSVGCFMTHCGWNSTIESLDSGVPVVAFPQQIDQFTNAKLIEDVWKTGVRVKDINAQGIVEREEIRRCLDMVMGGGGEEIKRNAKHWKELAKEAVAEGGSSDLNLKAFVTQIDNGCF